MLPTALAALCLLQIGTAPVGANPINVATVDSWLSTALSSAATTTSSSTTTNLPSSTTNSSSTTTNLSSTTTNSSSTTTNLFSTTTYSYSATTPRSVLSGRPYDRQLWEYISIAVFLILFATVIWCVLIFHVHVTCICRWSRRRLDRNEERDKSNTEEGALRRSELDPLLTREQREAKIRRSLSELYVNAGTDA